MIEGEQHVVDRRAVGHVGISALGNSTSSSHETAVLSTLRRANFKPRGARPVSVPLESSQGRTPDFIRNPADRLLKWFNSLYRPALPEGSADQPVRRFPDGLLGRRQVVRQGILIPPCGGSNPPAPARRWGRSRFGLNRSQTSPLMAGFRNSVASLQTPDFTECGPK